MSMATFIVTQGAQFSIPHATCCRALGVSQAWFYKWRHGDASPRRARRGAAGSEDPAAVRRSPGPLRLAQDHRRPAR